MHWLIERNNYDNDPRVRAADRKWWDSIDEGKMVAAVTIWNEATGEDEEVDIPIRYEVCPTCQGKGSHVNPSVDSNGLTAEDFAEDPDFAEEYMRGSYDVPCYGCGGNRVVPMIDEERADREVIQRLHQMWEGQEESRRIQAAERRMGA